MSVVVMSAPQDRSTDKNSARVGFRLSPLMASCDPGSNIAAAIKYAADEMSPGIEILRAVNLAGPSRLTTLLPDPSISVLTDTPNALNSRSVWSRVEVASITSLRPFVPRPANKMHDFTWALATGSGYRIGLRSREP